MRADDAREIDRQARARNRRERQASGRNSYLPLVAASLASWVVIAALALRLFRWWQS